MAIVALGLFVAACSTGAGTATQGTGAGAGPGFNLPPGGVGGADVTSGSTKDVKTSGADTAQAAPDTGPAAPDTAKPTPDTAATGEDTAAPAEDVQAPQDDAAAPEEDVDQGDTQPEDVPPVCTDNDGDGYCAEQDSATPDCDDENPNFTEVCPDCTKPGTEGCPCKAGVKGVSCYSGEQAWLGKGICAAGAHLCTDGFWTGCKNEVLPDTEKCDGKDNDCDGETDEGVKSTCGTCDLTCNEQKIGTSGPMKWNLNSENSTGLGLDDQGNLKLDATQISLNLKFIWIANSPQNTVSKLDCKTGQEVGRFRVCNDPSRTSVDLEGNVWVGCRGDGNVVKIIAEQKNCVDKNGDGIIQTSTNSGTTCNTPACDECVRFMVNPDGATIARAAGVDKDNHVWMGFWNSSNLRRLEPKNGATVDTVNIACNPYGLVIDQKGIIWAQGAGCGNLVRVDPVTHQVTKYPYNTGAYGINVDKFGKIWVSGSGNAGRFDPATLSWSAPTPTGSGFGRGIGTSNDGFVYISDSSASKVWIIDANASPPQYVGSIQTGSAPVGAALDYDGYVWAVNQGSSNASKMDPKAKAKIGDYPVGSSPYTYSDMTGYTLNYFTAPKGQFTTVFFGGIGSNPITTNQPKQVWQTISAEADLPEGTNLRIRLRAANTKVDLEAAPWSDPIDFPPETFPYDVSKKGIVGNLLQVEVQLLTKDKKLTPVLKSLSAKSKLQ